MPRDPNRKRSPKRRQSGLSPMAERRVLLARGALFYERIWPRVWLPAIIALVFCALAWFDFWHLLPGYVHGLLLLPFLAAFSLGLWRLVRAAKWPSRAEALARLERDSDLPHQPLQGLEDTLALGTHDSASQALWQTHIARARQALSELRVKAPRPDISAADPYAIRVVAVALALLGFFYAGPDWQTRLAAAVHPEVHLQGGASIAVNAWITPPTYTGAAPVFLTAAPGGHATIKVPRGSVLTVRVAGIDRAPRLRRRIKTPSQAPKGWRSTLSFKAEGPHTFKIDAPLQLDGSVEVLGGRRDLGRWNIALIQDKPPVVAFTGPVTPNDKDLLPLGFHASDDYGIATAQVRIQPAKPPAADASDDLALADEDKPLVIQLSLPPGKRTDIKAKQTLDLTASPWAGHQVTMTLAATDEAGQTGVSHPITLTLPKRQFHDPLAQAIIEQRGLLAIAPRTNRERIRRALEALTLAPERFKPDAITYLGLRDAYYRLGNKLTKGSVRSVYDLFWSLALHLEDGDLTLAEKELRDDQKKLMNALANNAPDSEIQKLMADLKSALGRYLKALNKQVEKAIARGEAMPPGVTPQGDVVSAQDFQNMMKAIEEMAKTGARGAAMQMLQQLSSILDNLDVGQPGARMTQKETAMSNALKGLSDIVTEQRKLLDETYRRSGQGGSPRPGDRSTNALAHDQAELRERLQDLAGALSEAMPSGLNSLKGAGKSMGHAQDALGSDNPGGAVSPESQAIQQLQRGMQNVAQALAKSLGGRYAVLGGRGMGRDPLGRARGQSGGMTDDQVQVPDSGEIQRARRILQELQERAGQRTRSQKELDYLDRLLKRF
jgi:uncharacterized protein (TIGR02302 family)